MKKILILLSCSLSIWINSFAQSRDYRGLLIPDGRVTDLSISPDEKLWIGTYLGALYYTSNFDSTWHICNSPQIFNFSIDDEYANKPMINKITFFNTKQAILTGNIALEKWKAKNGMYQTSDGGKTWKPIDFGGDMWVYDAFVDSSGNAWLGGSSGKLHYSKDFGNTWHICHTPSNPSIRIKSIFMSDSLQGILGTCGNYGDSKENYLYTTTDNWKNCTSLATPFSQGLFNSESKRLPIEEVFIWNNYYIVKQGNDYFYSDRATLKWKRFQFNLQMISIDRISKRIYGLTDSLHIIEIKNFETYVKINTNTIKRKPKTFNSVNDFIYILDEDNEIYKLNQYQANSSLLFNVSSM